MERLLNYFKPENYKIELNIDKHKGTARGRTTITGSPTEAGEKQGIKLHAVDLTIDRVRLNDEIVKFTHEDGVLVVDSACWRGGASRGPAASRAKRVEVDGRDDATGPRRIGLVKNFDNSAISPAIRNALKAQVESLKSRGHEIVELDMPTLKYALAVYYIVVPAEIASNLSRYDGIRYGYRAETAKNLDEIFANSRNDGFMPENKRRIMIGNFVLSSGFYDAYYLKAQKARTLIIEEYEKAFEKCDYILTPVAPNPAFKLGEKVNDPVSMYLEDVMSVPINLAGLPSLAFPAGEAETEDGTKIPLGLQLIGPRRSDKSLLDFAACELGKEEA